MMDGIIAAAAKSQAAVTLAEISATATQIKDWLVTAPVQTCSGPYAGGVAGWLDADGTASYAYGEITGYWLSWLSSIREECADVEARAAAAVGFLRSTWSGNAPPDTRLYLHPAPPDWRNRAVFTFDMAMIVRGLAHAGELVGIERCAAVARQIVPWLVRCIGADGALLTHVQLGAGSPLPCRWSTQPGPFQAKASAALLCAPPAWLPAELRDAARLTLDKWAGRAAEHSELHPRFYALEGRILAGETAVPDLAGTVLPSDGRLPEDLSDPAALVRADVLAQAIRILALVEGEEAAAAEARTVILADALLNHVDTSGAVLFRRGTGPQNVWCAIFAAQAFAWLAARSAGRAIEPSSLV